ncbi:MAG: hypothetical protein C0467_20380 [Planctomycetaceae bacterium]|nr:hypothetical protein [Planctomycetaceae bacterium]
MTRLIAVALLSVGILGFSAGRAAAGPGDATEKLLKDSKLDYKKLKDGIFKLVIETKQGISVVIIEEKKAGWADGKKNDVLYLFIYTEVLSTPADFKAPAGMLTKIAELNDRIRFGSLGYSKNADGSYSMFRNATVFLKNLDEEQLADYVILTHLDKFVFQKEFRGFLDGGQ